MTPLLKPDWYKDHVYLVQFPRAGIIPSASPFALKLETWLRVCDVPYSNISNNFTTMSAKGQIPFIEYNGEQIADSNFIIDFLKNEFKDPEKRLTKEEKSMHTAYMSLVEGCIVWCMAYSRSRENAWMATDEGFGKHLGSFKKAIFQTFMLGRIRRTVGYACHAQGIGRHSPEEVETIARNAFDSLETFLGNKDYFFGDSPTTLDCTAFGHLAQLLYTPLAIPEIKTYLETKCPNLIKMHNRLKTRYWPDWNEACEKLSLDTEWKSF